MKETILRNWGFKILALLLGFVLWFLVANIEDYSVTKTITGIPVELLNTEAITTQGKVFEIEQGDTIDIKVVGRRSVVEDLTADDFQATADLSELSITNSVQISVDAVSASVRREVDISIADSMMKVAIEDRSEEKLPITVVTNGTPQDGYAVVATSTTPNVVTLSGAAGTVKKVVSAQVEVDVDGMNEDVSARSTITLLDAYGEVIQSDKIQINRSSVTVYVDIKKTKEVPIEVAVTGDVADGYAIAGEVEYSPSTVLIAGEEADLRPVRSIQIDDIDVEGRDADYTLTVDIDNYLPTGIVILDGTNDIDITVHIEPLIERTLTIRSSNITIDGKQDGFSYTLPTDENQIEITLRGLTRDIESLSVTDLEPVIDVSELGSEGTYRRTITCKTPDGVTLSGTLTAVVVLEEKPSSTESSSGDTTEEAGSSASTETTTTEAN